MKVCLSLKSSGFGGFFDGLMEVMQAAQKLAEIEVTAGQRSNHFGNVGGDDIGLRELIHIEYAGDDALGHEVLDEHFVDGFDADVGVEGGAAELHEFVELVLEGGVVAVGGLDLVFELGSDLADLVAITLYGFVEVFVGLGAVIEILAEKLGEVVALVDGGACHLAAVLIEDSGTSVFEDDVG